MNERTAGGAAGSPAKVAAEAIRALDALAVALAGHNHTWTDEERHRYEHALARLSLWARARSAPPSPARSSPASRRTRTRQWTRHEHTSGELTAPMMRDIEARLLRLLRDRRERRLPAEVVVLGRAEQAALRELVTELGFGSDVPLVGALYGMTIRRVDDAHRLEVTGADEERPARPSR